MFRFKYDVIRVEGSDHIGLLSCSNVLVGHLSETASWTATWHCCFGAKNEFDQPFTPLIQASISREMTHKKILFLVLTPTS